MITHFVEALHKQIRQDIEGRTAGLARGTAATFEDYKKEVGVIHGLALAEDIAVALQRNMEHEDAD